jgi:hypothetical protein
MLLAHHADAFIEASFKPSDSRWVDALTAKYEGNRVGALVVAGALIAAEIDRLQRHTPTRGDAEAMADAQPMPGRRSLT